VKSRINGTQQLLYPPANLWLVFCSRTLQAYTGYG